MRSFGFDIKLLVVCFGDGCPAGRVSTVAIFFATLQFSFALEVVSEGCPAGEEFGV